MKRIPEPELMVNDEQAWAYAHADFEIPHSLFIQSFQEYFPHQAITGHVLDLGCGDAEISCRFAQTFKQCQIDGIDGSENMLKYGQERIERQGLTGRIRLIQGYLPGAQFPLARYDVMISNSLLHHLAHPHVLWETIKSLAKPSAVVFIMDLMRPESLHQVEIIVKQYAKNEPKILQRDFFNSLCAAYRIDEVEAQLKAAGLNHFKVHEVSDRHFTVRGKF